MTDLPATNSSYRVAIFSDVHGNLSALQAVLDAIDAHIVDDIIFAGDLCLYGPRPEACFDLLRSREDIASLYGNTDQAIAKPALLSDDIQRELEALAAKAESDIIAWTAYQLGIENRSWLRALPFHRRISPSVNPRDDLFVVHANPKDVMQLVFPPEEQQRELYDEVRQTDDDLYPLFHDLLVGAVAFGHLHVPFVRWYGDLMLVNVSSVSIPGDGDRRAKYAILEWVDDEGWSVEHHYVDYDVGPEIAAFEAARPPGWEEVVESLRERGFWPQRV